MFKKTLCHVKRITLALVFILAITTCKEVYNPHIQSPSTGYLVVEGFINSIGVTHIQLTRTTKLVDTASIIYEHSAQVFIESDSNESYPLQETGDGQYRSDSLFLNSSEKYRLHIKTSNGQEYLSEYSGIYQTPAIDSVTWQRDNEGVHIYVNSHDNATRYYKWNYAETWEFHSAYASNVKWIYENNTGTPIGVLMGPIDTTIYKCWKTINSSSLLLGNSEKLTVDRVYSLLHSIEPASVKLSVLYSISVHQRALSKKAYAFYEILKKNTEQLGSVFDAQPSELQGNIYNMQNKNETVIGFVEIGTEEQKRIFISNRQVPGWYYTQQCYEVYFANQPDSIRKYGPGLLPTTASLTKVNAAPQQCVDCRINGTNVRPDFWP